MFLHVWQSGADISSILLANPCTFRGQIQRSDGTNPTSTLNKEWIRPSDGTNPSTFLSWRVHPAGCGKEPSGGSTVSSRCQGWGGTERGRDADWCQEKGRACCRSD